MCFSLLVLGSIQVVLLEKWEERPILRASNLKLITLVFTLQPEQGLTFQALQTFGGVWLQKILNLRKKTLVHLIRVTLNDL